MDAELLFDMNNAVRKVVPSAEPYYITVQYEIGILLKNSRCNIENRKVPSTIYGFLAVW
jgi:hypothetical protein